MNNMQQLFKQAQKLQEKLTKAQSELEFKEVVGSSGAGLINVTTTLKGIIKNISIDKTLINPDEKDILEDLIVAALNDAKSKADIMFEEGMKEASGGMDLSKSGSGLF